MVPDLVPSGEFDCEAVPLPVRLAVELHVCVGVDVVLEVLVHDGVGVREKRPLALSLKLELADQLWVANLELVADVVIEALVLTVELTVDGLRVRLNEAEVDLDTVSDSVLTLWLAWKLRVGLPENDKLLVWLGGEGVGVVVLVCR